MKDKRVLITGGAAGIGLCLAREFAKAGSRLVITDINEVALEKAKSELSAMGVSVMARRVDVADKQQVDELVVAVHKELGGMDVLVNNAGIGHSGELIETSLDTWRKLIDVNFFGPLHHVYGFLPDMISSGSGRIVNVSSGQAFFRMPTWGAYACVKLALGAFSEILGHEIRKFGVGVTTVYPFMVDTGFYSEIEGETWLQKLSMKLVPYYSMKPEKVARIIFKAVRDGKSLELISPLNRLAKVIQSVPLAAALQGQITALMMGKSAEVLQKELKIG